MNNNCAPASRNLRSAAHASLRYAIRRALRPDARCLVPFGLGLLAASAIADPLLTVFPLGVLYPNAGGDGSLGFVIDVTGGAIPGGYNAGGVGDVNNDGYQDFAVLAATNDGCLVVYGAPLFPARRDDADVDGSWSFSALIESGGGNNCLFIDALGDVNGDGIDDFVVDDLIVFGRPGPFPHPFDLRVTQEGVATRVFFTNDPDADLDGSGQVNFADLAIMKFGFFLPPGPGGGPDLCD